MGQHRDLASGCWNWTRGCDPKGYPRIRHGEKILYAVRGSLYLYKGLPLEAKVRCLSTCKNRKCINPDHFDVVEQP